VKPLTISEPGTMIFAIQDEIRRSEQSRYDHRLHGVLLVAQGMTCPQVGHFLGDAPRSVEYWVRRFEERGFAGLTEGERPGRPRRLDDRQIAVIEAALRQRPEDVEMPGAGVWDGKTLSAFVKGRFGVELKVRQCQRLFRQLGFRMRKPRPVIAHADPEEQRAYKKTAQARRGRRRSLGHR
jgi:transposase